MFRKPSIEITKPYEAWDHVEQIPGPTGAEKIALPYLGPYSFKTTSRLRGSRHTLGQGAVIVSHSFLMSKAVFLDTQTQQSPDIHFVSISRKGIVTELAFEAGSELDEGYIAASGVFNYLNGKNYSPVQVADFRAKAQYLYEENKAEALKIPDNVVLLDDYRSSRLSGVSTLPASAELQ